MKVWTIQTYPAWAHFQNTGVLRADAAFIEPTFLEAYRWLVKQMMRCLGPAPLAVAFPIWVWYQWGNAHKRRPDLRHAAHLPRGECGVLLECECPIDSVLLSDFVLWHYVLNNWYLPTDEADEQAFDGHYSSPSVPAEERQQQKTDSWQRIFDLEWSDPKEEYAVRRDKKSIQGTLWELPLSQVQSAKLFVAR